MPAQIKYPGVYVEEIPSGIRSIEGAWGHVQVLEKSNCAGNLIRSKAAFLVPGFFARPPKIRR